MSARTIFAHGTTWVREDVHRTLLAQVERLHAELKEMRDSLVAAKDRR